MEDLPESSSPKQTAKTTPGRAETTIMAKAQMQDAEERRGRLHEAMHHVEERTGAICRRIRDR